VFLESAYFNPTWVRKTARRHGLNTDSSFRFERGADPGNTMYVLKRAAMLIKEIAGGEIEGEIRDIYPVKINNAQVVLPFRKVNSLIGKEIPKETIKNILQSLDIETENESEEALTLSIPTYRVDVTRDVDVIEEILRIYGYNNVDFSDSLRANLSYQTPTDRKHKLQTLISEQLTASGFSEIMNNSLTRKSYYEDNTTFPGENGVKLLNPLSNDLGVMRQTLLYGGLESIAYNRNRKHYDLHFYEFGNCYFFDTDRKQEGNILSGYSEETHLGLWICGDSNPKNWAALQTETSVFQLKAHIENILNRLGFTQNQVTFESTQSGIYASGMNIRTFNRQIGSFGIISGNILKKFDIDTDVFFAEMSWDALLKETSASKVHFSEISRFPSVSRDLALLVDKSVTFAAIEQTAKKAERKLLQELSLFDVYEGKNLPEGKKSYAVNFVLQDKEKTLNDKQIDAVMQKIQQNLEKELGALLR
jgi:phenylalanyl-tRNA synthetase beta chain